MNFMHDVPVSRLKCFNTFWAWHFHCIVNAALSRLNLMRTIWEQFAFEHLRKNALEAYLWLPGETQESVGATGGF